MKPLIGITAGEITNKNGRWAPDTYGQSYTYSDAIIHAGGIPVTLPLTADPTIWQEFYERCDGLLFTGGNDIDPARYGHQKSAKTRDVSKFRDAQEFALMQLALGGSKPLLAICRGMQLLNVACGGTLYQDIATEVKDAQDHEASTNEKDMTHLSHMLRIAPDSRLERTLEVREIAANAHHHQGVCELGSGLVATAWAEDGVVEGIELVAKRFVVGVQAHPEALEAATEIRWANLFEAFVSAAKKARSGHGAGRYRS